jgi:TonB family protein
MNRLKNVGERPRLLMDSPQSDTGGLLRTRVCSLPRHIILIVFMISNGRVGQIDVEKYSDHEVLDQSAPPTGKQWKFIPVRKGEGPIPFRVNISIKFQFS